MARPVIDAHSIVYYLDEGMQTSGRRRIRARLERRIAKKPEVDLYIKLAYYEARQHNWDSANEAIDSALELEPDHADALLMRAQILESGGKHQEALKAYEDVIQQHKDFSKAYREYGRFFMKEEDTLSTAQTYLLRALELNPKDALAHLLLAEVFMQKERTSQALLHLDIAKRFQEEEPLFHGRSIQLFLKLEEYEEAARQLKLALKHDPKNKHIRAQSRDLEKKLKQDGQVKSTQFWKRWNAK